MISWVRWNKDNVRVDGMTGKAPARLISERRRIARDYSIASLAANA
jgi:hypothetical protein